MRTKKVALVAALVIAIGGIGLGYLDHSIGPAADARNTQSEIANDQRIDATGTSAKNYLSAYIVDKNHQISFKDTGLNEDSNESEPQLKDSNAANLVNRGTADYFRFLQTHFSAGATLRENTEAIRQHLLTTLPKDDATKLFELYQKFVDFEFSIGDKTKGWKMPENPDETLALIGKMQKLQQEHFGAENADLLYGGELKTMEYTARRAGILNDKVSSGAEKEALLKKLATDMFGPEADKLDEKKNPYNLFEEKLLVYKNDLDKLDPLEQEKMIKNFRDKYLPARANAVSQ